MAKTTKTKVTTEPYKVSIKFFGKVYTATGSTLKEAIEKLDVGRSGKGSAVLSVTKGSRTQDKILPMDMVARLFSLSKLMREIAIKQTLIRFDI